VPRGPEETGGAFGDLVLLSTWRNSESHSPHFRGSVEGLCRGREVRGGGGRGGCVERTGALWFVRLTSVAGESRRGGGQPVRVVEGCGGGLLG